MKIMMVISLYSGFEKSLADGIWRPSGAPAISKLIAELDRRRVQLGLFILGKRQGQVQRKGEIALVGLQTSIVSIPRLADLPRLLSRFHYYVNEIIQVLAILRAFRKSRPDLVYVDRANVLAGALFARFTKTPVVFRLLGVHRTLHPMVEGRRPYERLTRWAYRSPFAAVICSQDGSGAEKWLDRLFRQSIPRHLMINGVDDTQQESGSVTLPSGKTLVLFVGRLELEKGCDEFVTGFLDAWEKDREGLHGIIVGDGARIQTLQKYVTERNAERAVTFTGALPHDQVPGYLAKADIYVSLNRMGNLSNANLEAMKAGRCMILPTAQPATGADLATEEVLPPDTALRIPSTDDVKALTEAIFHLHQNPTERKVRGEATALCANKTIPSWPNRLETEIEILEKLSRQSNETG